MPPPDKPWRPFVVLIAADRRLVERALKSVLEESGYAVLGADGGVQALQLARTAKPDAVLLDSGLGDMTALEVARRLSGDPEFSATTPIILLTTHGTSRNERLEAYASGAWDLCSQPLDGAALLLKLQIYMRARQAAERLREGALVDDVTGLYNLDGLRRRAGELAADARRRREPLACIALVATVGTHEGALDVRAQQFVARVLERQGRGSDVVGRIGGNGFGLLATATTDAGASRIIERLHAAFAAAPPADAPARSTISMRAGFRATNDLAQSATSPFEMLLEARASLTPSLLTLENGGLGRLHSDQPRGVD